MTFYYKKMIISNKLTLSAIFILGSILFSNFSHGQAPGLVGKRFLIGFEAPMIVTGLLYGNNNYEDYWYYSYTTSKGMYNSSIEKENIRFRIKPTLTLEYILDRKTSFQAVIRYFSPSVHLVGFRDTIITSGVSSEHDFNPTEKADMRNIVVGGKFKFFRNEDVNPVGSFWYIGAEYHMQSLRFSENNFISLDRFGSPIYKNPNQTTSSNFVITGGLGKQFTIGNSLLFNFGLDFGLPVTNLGFSNLSITSENYTDKTSNQEIWGNSLFNVNIGIALAP